MKEEKIKKLTTKTIIISFLVQLNTECIETLSTIIEDKNKIMRLFKKFTKMKGLRETQL